MGSPEMERIQACAREHGIAVSLGFSENDNNSLFISNVLIGADGAIKVHRRKMKPTHMERTVFGDASGHCLRSVAELPFGRVGSLSCWEHIQPLLKYNTISQKEEIHVAAWPPLHSQVGESIPWSMTAEGIYIFSSSVLTMNC
jgi:predicted amidohydrolase